MQNLFCLKNIYLAGRVLKTLKHLKKMTHESLSPVGETPSRRRQLGVRVIGGKAFVIFRKKKSSFNVLWMKFRKLSELLVHP